LDFECCSRQRRPKPLRFETDVISNLALGQRAARSGKSGGRFCSAISKMFSAKWNELYFTKLNELDQNYEANFVWLKEIIGETKKNFYA
jgi:hypothetical protein